MNKMLPESICHFRDTVVANNRVLLSTLKGHGFYAIDYFVHLEIMLILGVNNYAI